MIQQPNEGGSGVPPEVRHRLREYALLVRDWAPRLDLVSDDDVGRFEERHITDSLRPLALLPELPEGPICDVGSGAGLPGIPLALASGRFVRLIEPRKRRAAFLEECLRVLHFSGEVVVTTAQSAGTDVRYSGAHAAAFARALAPPSMAAQLILPLVMAGGIGVVFLGGDAELPPGAEEWSQGLAIVRHK